MGSFRLDCILLTEGSIVKVLGVILVSAEGGTTGSYATVINSLDENPSCDGSLSSATQFIHRSLLQNEVLSPYS